MYIERDGIYRVFLLTVPPLEVLSVSRVPLIGGLPPTLTSFKIISSQSICSTFLIIVICLKPGFLRGNIYTSCISMVLLDHFANKSNTCQHSLSLPLSRSPSLALPFPPISSLGLHFLLLRILGYRN